MDILKTIPQVKGDKQDNPEDLKAIEDGFNTFKNQFPEEAEDKIITLKDVIKARKLLMEKIRKNQ